VKKERSKKGEKERKRERGRGRERDNRKRDTEWITFQIEGMAYINIIYSIQYEWPYVKAIQFSIGTNS
jgi:hypothetical protein